MSDSQTRSMENVRRDCSCSMTFCCSGRVFGRSLYSDQRTGGRSEWQEVRRGITTLPRRAVDIFDIVDNGRVWSPLSFQPGTHFSDVPEMPLFVWKAHQAVCWSHSPD